jgi:hypothetical protein
MTMRRIIPNFHIIFSSKGTSEISQPQSGWNVAQRFFQIPQGRRTFSTVPSGRIFLRTVFQPLRSWLIFGCRSATQFAVATMILVFAVGAMAETTNTLSDAEIQGRNLAQQLLEQPPPTNFIQVGALNIRDAGGNHTNIPVKVSVSVYRDHWWNNYETFPDIPHLTSIRQKEELGIDHRKNLPNSYSHSDSSGWTGQILPQNIETPFANSDFWLCDLGLEFFHWPEQKILPNPTPLTRGRSYTLLESTNPNPSTNGYSRVLSWIDKESGGILEAEAYDAQGKLLKVFEPKSFKKVDGQWQLQEMEIRNVQTGSRTRLEFDLNKP